MIINITPTGVVESTIMYGVVHAIWSGAKIIFRQAEKEMRLERNRIIHRHVKSGHKGHPLHCFDDVCLSLRKPGQPLPEQELRTE